PRRKAPSSDNPALPISGVTPGSSPSGEPWASPREAQREAWGLPDFDVRQDGRGLEHDTVEILAGLRGLQLLHEEGHVVGQAQEVFLVLARAGLAGDRNLPGVIIVAQAAQALDGEHVVARDAIVKHDTAIDFKVVRSRGKVA